MCDSCDNLKRYTLDLSKMEVSQNPNNKQRTYDEYWERFKELTHKHTCNLKQKDEVSEEFLNQLDRFVAYG